MCQSFVPHGSYMYVTAIHIITYVTPTDISHLIHLSSGPADCSAGTVSGCNILKIHTPCNVVCVKILYKSFVTTCYENLFLVIT